MPFALPDPMFDGPVGWDTIRTAVPGRDPYGPFAKGRATLRIPNLDAWGADDAVNTAVNNLGDFASGIRLTGSSGSPSPSRSPYTSSFQTMKLSASDVAFPS